MKPEDFLDPANFPPDLKWVPEHYKLHPSDPVYLLIAWHWKRVKASEDTLSATVREIKAALDYRLEAIKESAKGVAAVGEALAKVQAVMEMKPEALGRQLEQELAQPLATAVARLQDLARNLAPVARSFATARRHQTLAALLVGVALGTLSSLILFFA